LYLTFEDHIKGPAVTSFSGLKSPAVMKKDTGPSVQGVNLGLYLHVCWQMMTSPRNLVEFRRSS